MASLQADGVFLDYDRSMNPAAIGFPLVAFTTIHANQQHLADIVSVLVKIPEIVQAHSLTGPSDILVQIVASSAEELVRVNAEILACPSVERTETSIAMSERVPYRLSPLIARNSKTKKGLVDSSNDGRPSNPPAVPRDSVTSGARLPPISR
ncbi:MAG: Lrp/AsnC ligand binding domain-containing protein [Actinomycetota bacterium]|nr:Lrp/AsnC ligand binding domain-containing protein [Actinomycetota bacterium]